VTREWAGLTNVEVVSGTAKDGPEEYRGFVTVRAVAEDGSVMAGQLPPDELRGMALNFLSVAEAAEQDAMVMKVLTKTGVEEDAAALVITMMRGERDV
jgi:16S rRNA G527 N7-methylase RsmG